MSTKKTSKKYAAVITYCIALVCLLLGLFLPVYNGNELLFMALPDAFCKAVGLSGSSVGNELTREFMISYGQTTFDLIPVLVALYAVVAAIGVIMLIPVLASGSKKKTARVCAYIVEVAAVLVLFAYLYAQLIAYTRFKTDGGTGFIWDYGVIGIALGGAALMLIVQSIAYKGRSGIMKLAMALLGAIAVFCLLDIPAIFNFTRTDVFGGNLYVGYYNDVDAITVLSNFFSQGLTFFGRTAANMFTGTVIAVLALLVIVNFAIDLIELSANTTKGGIIFDIVRYGAELVLLVIGIVMLFVLNVQDLSPGLLIGIIFLAALVQVILSSIRCGLYRKSGKERKVEPVNAPVPVQQFAYTAPAYTTPAPTPAPATAPAPAPVSVQTLPAATTGGEIVYAPKEVYRGPSDEFIAKLEESEKIEFGKTFLDRQKGPCPELPEYVVGGDNREFFNAIFLYLGKYRSMISDGLMSKIYEELNRLN